MGKGLAIRLFRTVNIKMIGINGRDDRHVGRQMMKRTVVLIGLDDHKGAVLIQKQVRAVVHTDAAEEGIGAQLRLIEQMGQHGAGRRLAVGTGHAQGFHLPRHKAQDLGTLADIESFLAQIGEYRTVLRHRRRTYDQRVLLGERRELHGGGIVNIRDDNTLLLQLFGQIRGRAVIA